ncbi:PREDICTED: uncharacterized protein LOC107169989 [Diuraphis noxia]|uniref:uncharacterized protein LOC107169989 n=1 Tax=Diuraphis noxia TaxID=143948 RepID=UPI000763AF90|nr:PREDICTED: uncharacterized protein LOC107169989 [Diuraphis noxia]
MSARQWTDDDIFELINLYEEKEFLWNVNHKLYRNRDKKMSAFEEIATKFNCDVNEVQRKIHNLRNQVSHELQKMKKVKSGDGADDRYESKWKFFSALKFIVPCFIPTKTTSNMVSIIFK